MNLKFVSLILSLVVSVATQAVAQNQNQNNTGTQEDGAQQGIAGFWEVITADGRFVARLDQIASVSEHQYLIDGGVRVYECTVDTDGGQTARFYYLEPVTDSSSVSTGSATISRLRDIANQATNKAGMGDVDTIVTKNYPTTTHAKTSEYRVKNKATIGQIYEHARRVWAEERGRGNRNRLVIVNG
ncbi:MAG: hypothetical protein AAGA96_19040 [Verrucomicrobiota bacterium]